MILHCFHAYNLVSRWIMLHATDTDLWMAFGHGDHFRYISAHAIAIAMGPDYCRGRPFMHALTDCDPMSLLSSIGKKTAWKL